MHLSSAFPGVDPWVLGHPRDFVQKLKRNIKNSLGCWAQIDILWKIFPLPNNECSKLADKQIAEKSRMYSWFAR